MWGKAGQTSTRDRFHYRVPPFRVPLGVHSSVVGNCRRRPCGPANLICSQVVANSFSLI
ncbi:unnamed protein product [Haemonchus placei]|uniref:Uncharacterized protein n=1 Tax=Haemonchus placei TaxID=6290 RepID=A0A0N4WX52_HAEPC|nr:unnamed protein product [Haemonchus placei]